MAYSLRDIIKQRTGETASSNKIYPTIYKFDINDEWIEDYDITSIGTPKNNTKMDVAAGYYKKVIEETNGKRLPNLCYVRQAGTNVREVHKIFVENIKDLETVFKYAVNVVDFDMCLTSLHLTSQDKDNTIKNLPKDMFKNCHKAKSFYGAFAFLPIEYIPEGLFDNCPDVKDFTLAFAQCRQLISIPENLFANNKKVTSFESCFYGCESLSSKVPKLWETHADINGIRCFEGCNYIENKFEIPTGWK